MKNVEDIYPMSPMQELMLLHLLAERDSTVLFEQMGFMLHGELDSEAFQRAWQHVVDRHPMLRTAFLTEGLERPLQVVRQKASLSLEEHDWQRLSDDEWRHRLDVFLQEDRRRGFDPAQAPLMRLALMRLKDDQHCLVMSLHHVLLDRWSIATVLNEAVAAYESFRRDQTPQLTPVVRYREYVEWLEQRDLAQDESYWRSRLAGFTMPTPLPYGPAAAPAGSSSTQQITLNPAISSALESFARGKRVTMNVLFQAIWGLVLADSSGERDVVFGMTVSGRPAELPGVEMVVGLFINNIPVRVKIAPDEPVGAWLESLQEQHGELQQHEHTPLGVIQQWSEIAGGRLLFDSLLVFQNDAARPADAPDEPPSLIIRPLGGEMRTNYALTLTAVPASPIVAMLTYDPSRFDEVTIVTMLRNVERLLERIVADPTQRLEALLSGLDHVPRSVEGSSVVQPPSAPSVSPVTESTVGEAPKTESEVAIAEIWKEVLGVDRVSVHDNFFDLGGTSVLALKSIAKLESEHGKSISAFELMTQTLAQVAAVSSSRRSKRKRWWSKRFGRA